MTNTNKYEEQMWEKRKKFYVKYFVLDEKRKSNKKIRITNCKYIYIYFLNIMDENVWSDRFDVEIFGLVKKRI